MTALGAVSEALMALYGITRMLQSRELSGPKILPAVQAFADDIAPLEPQLRRLFEALGDLTKADPPLQEAVTALREPAFAVVSGLAAAFDEQRKRRKLNARERLRLEMRTLRLGGELDAIKMLVDLLYAAVEVRPADLSVADMATGRWSSEPTFSSQPIDLTLDLPNGVRFRGDPKVTWGLLDGCLRWLVDQGVNAVLLRCYSFGEDAVHLQLQPRPAREDDSARLPVQRLSLGVHLPVECTVIRAVAAHRNIGLKLDEASRSATIRV